MPARLIALGVTLAACTTAARARVIITEIHYNPAGGDGRGGGLEFVELYNDEPLPFDLGGYRLGGGIHYLFSPAVVIGAFEALVVARDPMQLIATHGLNESVHQVLGPYGGRLDNGGDEVVLFDTGNSAVCRVRYNDRNRWPAAADGLGASLVLRDPIEDPSRSSSWGWSTELGPTPAAVSFETVTSRLLINEVFRSPAGDWVEFFNPAPEALELAGFLLALDAARERVVRLPEAPLPGRGLRRLELDDPAYRLGTGEQRLFVIAGDSSRIEDARRLDPQVDGESHGRYPDGSTTWQLLEPPTPGKPNAPPPTAPIVISEIHYHPLTAEERDEFVELVNTGDEPVDAGGYRFADGIRFTFAEGTMIAPGEYVVVARDPDHLRAAHDLDRVLGPYERVLANSGERLRLEDRRGNTVDEVNYHDDGDWPRWADGHGPSLELTDLRQDNASGVVWRESVHTAPWKEYEYTAVKTGGDSELHLFLMGRGAALIDDVEIVRSGGSANHLPDGSFDGDPPLAGWIIEGTHIDSDLARDAGPDGSNALRVVASKRGDTRANRIERQTAIAMRNGAEYRVRFQARWLRGMNRMMTRSFGHGMAHSTLLEVPSYGGTPGRTNSTAVKNSGPVIGGLEQDPALPAAGATVNISARVSDPDGVERATLYFRLDTAEGFQSARMRDDGGAADAVAGDGVYAAVIPQIGSRARTVEFYVAAADALMNERVYPPGAPERTLVYQYDDNVAPHDVPAYRVVMHRNHYAELLGRSHLSNHRLPATLIYRDERIFHGAEIRYRGSPFLRRDKISGAKKGFRLRLPDENPLSGAVRITLDEQATEPTYQVDRIVRHLLQRAGGVPYGERRHVNVIVRGRNFGTYERVLTVDPLYLKRAFGEENDDGELYKIDAHYEIDDQGEFGFPTFTSWRYTTDKEDLRFVYKKRSHEGADDYSRLMELLRFFDRNETSPEELEARAPGVIDVAQWVRALAVYRAVDDWDTIGGWTGKNVYLYGHPDGRWRLIPWDHDVALGSAALQPDQNARAYIYTPYYPELSRLLKIPFIDRQLNAELLRLLEEDFTAKKIGAAANDTWSLLQQTSGAAVPSSLVTFVRARRNHLLAKISDPPRFLIETNGGASFETAEPSATVCGQAPYRVATVMVPRRMLAFRWQSLSTWRMSVSLEPGANSLTFFAFDRDGGLTDSASLEITFRRPVGAFVRGDVNDDQSLNIADPIRALTHLFGGDPVTCLDAVDANDSGTVNIADAIYLLNHLFAGGPQPHAPYPLNGMDPTDDELGCRR